MKIKASLFTAQQKRQIEEVALQMAKTPIHGKGSTKTMKRVLQIRFPGLSGYRLQEALQIVTEFRDHASKVMRLEKLPTPPLQPLTPKAAAFITEAARLQTEALATMSYPQFLTCRYWLLVRMAKLDECCGQCERCGRRVGLQVHHLDYSIRGREHENLKLLQVLCDHCHRREHRI